jgi:hypothetical protein
MFRFALAAIVGCAILSSATFAAEPAALTGYVVKLGDKTNASEPTSVNVGGLVIAIVRDSGSRPPQDIKVSASDSLKPLGTVRGVQNDDGQALMGGGYTWHLFQPTSAGDATVEVAYTQNGDNGKRVERKFQLSVTAE